MATVFVALVLSSFTKRGSREFRSHTSIGQCHVSKAMRTEKPLEELLYHVQVERKLAELGMKAMRTEKPLEELLYHVQVERKLAELGISRWSTGKFKLPWDWHVDRLVYIEEGEEEVRVVPEGIEHFMQFMAGDLVRSPKWFEAHLF